MVFSSYPATLDDGPKHKLVKVYVVSDQIEKLSSQNGMTEEETIKIDR